MNELLVFLIIITSHGPDRLPSAEPVGTYRSLKDCTEAQKPLIGKKRSVCVIHRQPTKTI